MCALSVSYEKQELTFIPSLLACINIVPNYNIDCVPHGYRGRCQFLVQTYSPLQPIIDDTQASASSVSVGESK